MLLEDVENVSGPLGLWDICRTCQLQKLSGSVCVSDDALEAKGSRCQSRSSIKLGQTRVSVVEAEMYICIVNSKILVKFNLVEAFIPLLKMVIIFTRTNVY